jgi:hypothetical protein
MSSLRLKFVRCEVKIGLKNVICPIYLKVVQKTDFLLLNFMFSALWKHEPKVTNLANQGWRHKKKKLY